MSIRTNHQPRPVLRWDELTAKERAKFDYLDDEQKRDEASFFRYRGWVYDFGEFQYVDNRAGPCGQNGNSAFKGWDGFLSDSYFSAILVRYTNDYDDVVVGTFID